MTDIFAPIEQAMSSIKEIDAALPDLKSSETVMQAHNLRYQYLKFMAGHILGQMELSRRRAGIELPDLSTSTGALQSLTDPEAIIWRSQQ